MQVPFFSVKDIMTKIILFNSYPMRKNVSSFLIITMSFSLFGEIILPFREIPKAKALASPTCALDISPNYSGFSGEDFTFSSTIANSGADPGFSPIIELVLPAQITLNSSTFSLGGLTLSPVSPSPITVTDNDGGSPLTGTVTNPITNTLVTLPVGNIYRAYRLPLGSFVPGQTPVSMDFAATLSSAPPIGVTLTDQIQSRCGFSLGSDPLNNPNIDPPNFSAFASSQVTPTLLVATKTMVTTDGEQETATGENFPVTYTIGTNIANGKTITDVTLDETIPSTEQLIELTSKVGNADQITFTPTSGPVQTYNSPFSFPIPISAPGPGGSLQIHYPSVTGTTSANDATLTFKIFVPDKDSSAADILPPSSGGSTTINNTTSVDGTYLASPVSDTLASPVQLQARALAVQKSSSIAINTNNAGVTPGDTIQYTLNFQVSDYFTENNLVIEDLIPDGMTYVPGTATLSVTEDGATNSGLTFNESSQAEANVVTGNPPPAYNFGLCAGCTLAITADTVNNNDAVTPPGDGRTVMAFDVSTEIDQVGGEDDILEGGMVGPTPSGQPTRGTITYRAIINENYIDSQPNDESIDADDDLVNNVKVTAQVINGAPTGNYTSDTSGETITIVEPTYAKTLIGHLPNGGTLDVLPFVATQPLKIAPTDLVTYRLTVDVPSGDMEKLRIKDFLPIPFFESTEITTFDTGTFYTPTDGVGASVPAAGHAGYTTATSGMPGITGGCPSIDPVIVATAATNTVEFNYDNQSCFEKTPSTPIHIEILFTVSAQPKPMANSLKLVNLATFTLDDSTTNDVAVDSQIIDILTAEPELEIKKGVISTDKAGATFTPATAGPVAFTSPGTNPPFTGPFSSTDLDASPIDSDISNVDAGDKVRFAIVVENFGEAKAYDINVTEAFPTGFTTPTSVADLNLKVYDAFGSDRTADTEGGLFGFQANGGASLAGDTTLQLKSGASFNLPQLTSAAGTVEGGVNEGKNILVIVYELKVDQAITAYQAVTNTAQLTKFTSQPGSSSNYLDPTDPYEDDAITTIPGLSFTKNPIPAPSGDMSYTACATPANCRATIGEPVRYKLPVTMPEGTTTFVLNDNIPAGLGYFITNGVTVDGTTASCPEAISNFSGTLPTVTVNSPLGAGVAGSGVDVQATFTNAIVTNNNITTDNTFCIFYDVVLLNPLNNPVNKTNSATLTVGSNVTSAQTGTVRGRQPIIDVSKGVAPTSGDAGDVVTYTITLSHNASSNADATDISLSDVLPADIEVDMTDAIQNFATDGLDNDNDTLIDGADTDETGSTFYNTGTKTFTFNKTTTNNTLFDQLPVGSTILLTFKAELKSTVSPSQIITNTANLTYDSILGTPVSGIQKNGTNNGSVNLNVVTVTAGKSVNSTNIPSTGTSQFSPANNDLTIGEQVTYRVTVNVPEGDVTNLTIVDNIPSKFRIDSASLVSDTTGSPAPVIALTDTNADLINDRATITFATILTPAIPSTSPTNRTIDIDIVATVLDNVANANAQTKTNNVSVNWSENTGAAATASVVTDVVEPNLLINKTISPNSGDAGDLPIITLQASHQVASTSSAYQVVITDAVPSGMTIQNFATDGLDNDGDTVTDDANEATLYTNIVSGQNITINTATTGNVLLTEFPLASTFSFQFKVLINNTVSPGQVITNTGNLTYDSAPGANPDQRTYNTSDNDTFTVNSILPGKVVFSTDLADTGLAAFNAANEDLAIGETVTYRVTTSIPESTLSNYIITDTLPPRFKAISGSLIQDDGVSHSFTLATLQDNQFADGIDDTVVFNFGTVINAPDADSENVIVEIVAKVIDVPANSAGTPYTNTATITYTELVGTLTATANTDVVEPNLSITKAVLPVSGDAGDQFEYTIIISNTGTAPAYDVQAVDDPDNVLNLNTPFAADTVDNNGDGVDGDANELIGSFYDGNIFTWNNATTSNALFSKLDPGSSITLKYRVTLSTAATPNQVVANTVNLDYDTWPGANPDQRSTSKSANASLTVASNADIQKELRNADLEKVIGETVPYRIKVRVPEGTVDGLVVQDVLPAGLAMIPGTVAISTTNAPQVTWDGTPQNPGQAPASSGIGAGSSQTLTFNFGNVANTNTDNGTDEQVIIEYDAVVMNTADNNNNDTKQNVAQATIGTAGGVVGPVSAPLITVIEPILNITLTSTYTTGNTITYQIELENNATSPNASAWDVNIDNLLPAGVTYAGNLILVNGPGLPSVNTGGAPNIVFGFNEINPIYNSGNPIIFTFDAVVSNSVPSATILTDTATVTGTSISGTVTPAISGNNLSGERTGLTADAGGVVNDYTDTDNLPLTITRPDLSTSFKTVTDLNGGTVEANDVLQYHMEIINTGNTAASGIHVSDSMPPNINSFNITTLPITGTNNSLPDPAGTNTTGLLDFTNISLGAAGSPTDTEIIEFTVVVDIGLPDGTNFVNNFTVDPSTEGGPGGSGTASTGSTFPVLVLDKNVIGPSSVKPGELTTYEVTVTNTGSSPSTNATLVDTIPTQLQYIGGGTTQLDTVAQTDAVDGDPTDFNISTPGTLTLVIPSIAVSQTITLQYTVSPLSGTEGQSVTNTINVTDDQGSDVSSSANISIPSKSGGGGGPGGGRPTVEKMKDVFEEEVTNQRDETCEEKPAQPEIIPTACLQLVANRDLQFKDTPGDSYAAFINTLKNTQIIRTGDYVFSGTDNHSSGKQQSKYQSGDWEFQPERQVTRLEAVKTALISNCIPIDDTVIAPQDGFQFIDLPIQSYSSDVDDFAERVFYTAYNHGVIKGDEGKAKAYNNVTTPEALAISLRAAQVLPTNYEAPGPWYAKYERFAKDNGLLNNTSIKDFTAPLLRKDLAKILVRVMAYNPDPNIYGYIERVDIVNQKFDWRNPVLEPQPDLGEEEQCKVKAPESCLEHDANRELAFDDTPKDSWYYPYSDILRTTKIKANGDYIASGHGNQSTGRQQEKYRDGEWLYEPERYTSRLEITKVALVANCISVEDVAPIPANGFRFSDLPVDVNKSDDLNNFASRVFYTAYKHGIITGENLIEARPFDLVNRTEALTILTRASKNAVKGKTAVGLPYIDTSNEAWYARILSYAWENGMVGGSGEKLFKGDRNVKRSEMSKMVYSFMLFNDNPGIRQYAQSLKKFYNLPDFEFTMKPEQTEAPMKSEKIKTPTSEENIFEDRTNPGTETNPTEKSGAPSESQDETVPQESGTTSDSEQ